ncbi:hypothetical protein FO519_002073 [Halicephalobus sp. NKZ332]|nr:hypothetical protein FO519_002073 [Halicephalobus sp. NKZ332]
MGDDPNIVAGRKCLKCDLPALYYSVNPKQAVYCKDCFLSMVLHKFKFSLGSNKIFKGNTSKKVLLLYKSGSDADDYLVHVIRDETERVGQHNRLPAEPEVLIVLETINDEELRSLLAVLDKKLKDLEISWPVRSIHFTEVFKQDIEFVNDDYRIEERYSKLLKHLFQKSTVKSDRMELKRLLLELLVYRVAKKLQIDKVMISDTADTTSQNIFNAICFGRGALISHLSSVVDTRFPELSVIRPLREIFLSDIKLIMKLRRSVEQGLGDLSVNQVQIKSKSSVQDYNLQELTRLQTHGFPSTFTNVIQTAGKVKSTIDPEATVSCYLCFEVTDQKDFCGSCNRVFNAIPGFPDELKHFFSQKW